MTFTFELNEELLNPVLQTHFGHPTAVGKSFSVVALKPGLGNPTSLGVYRVAGSATVDAKELSFTLVVKHLASGAPVMDTSSPLHWNYWRREIEFFESPLVELIASGIEHPSYLGKSDLPDGTVLFWNSDLGDLTKSQWSWEKCLEAAELVAQLNSISATVAEPFEWLNRTQWHGWLEMRDEYFVPYEQTVRDCAQSDPVTAKAYQNWGPFLNQQRELSEIVWNARQCFVHGDFNLNNLVPLKSQGIIALDWQLCGVSGVGSEVASIFNTAVELGVIDGTVEQFNQITLRYTSRFNQLNPGNEISLDEVRLVAAALGYVIILGVSFYFLRTSADSPPSPAAVQALVDRFSSNLVMTYSTVLHQLL